jgi:hypothetical protein
MNSFMSASFAVIPFLGWLVESSAFLVALTLAVPVTLLTIAIAWMAFRSLLGGLLIAASIGSIVLFRYLHKPRIPQGLTVGP